MTKNYVLDTNVILYDHKSLFSFEDNNIYIPMVVLEELDGFKKETSELGYRAREAIRILDDLRQTGKLTDGVNLESGGKLFIIPFIKTEDTFINPEYVDNKLLQISAYFKKTNDENTVLVTKDINLRVRADVMGIKAEDYKNPQQGNGVSYSGIQEMLLPGSVIDELYKDGFIPFDEKFPNVVLNQYLIIKSLDESKHTCLAKRSNDRIVTINGSVHAVNIYPKNVKQRFALDALLDPEIKLVTLSGISGTGKTLLAVACGLQQILKEQIYDKMVITRPIVSVGKEMGFLPGDLGEKMEPWMQPIYDAIDFIMENDRRKKKTEISINFNYDDYIQVAPLSNIRGRNFFKSFMIIDESQNLNNLEVKTIITRAAEGTKIILTGDIYQIDDPYLNKYSNGLSQLIKKFKGQSIYAHVTMTDGERSKLAELAAQLL